ncbi:MAG: type II toxin-antitoxin system HicB family antitoxin [Deltaproteobacteria bacterium]|nr:type II toxin-antitoxin system HicB family antitoxin [Deltaproteobacteria bacterium]MCK5681961.1 type II toxin-antitoxin system HicB family antitoxin [bacterium]
MRTFIYPATIEQDDEGSFLVTFRDIDFAVTEGKTIDEALENAADCLCEALASCIADNEEIPLASETIANEHLITPTALIAAKAALYTVVSAQGLSKTALAGILGVSETVGRRLLDPRHQTKLSKIDQALNCMGKKMVVGVS